MSARLSAMTGEEYWEDRYNKYEPKLNLIIKEVIFLSSSLAAKRFISATDTSNNALVVMERTSFLEVQKGRLEQAKDILFSDEYKKHKSIYAKGISRLLDGTIFQIKKNVKEYEQHMVNYFLIAIAIILVSWVIVFFIFWKHYSKRKELESALVEAKTLADEANKTKGDFLANMSHEIRTPMNGIIELTHLALTTELPSVQNDYLKKIQSSSHNLLTIINDIFDVSKIVLKPSQKKEAPFPQFEDLDPYIEELKHLIENNNLKALDYLATIEETFKETPIKEFLGPVKGHLNRFNFIQAAKCLADLRNDLKTSLEIPENV